MEINVKELPQEEEHVASQIMLLDDDDIGEQIVDKVDEVKMVGDEH